MGERMRLRNLITSHNRDSLLEYCKQNNIRGTKRNCHNCLAANFFKHNGFQGFEVHRGHIYFNNNGWLVKLPMWLQELIADFDLTSQLDSFVLNEEGV